MPAACGAPTATLAANAVHILALSPCLSDRASLQVSFLKQNITGWQAVGCAPSSSLSGSSTNDAAGMSIEKCLNICAGKNQQFAGLSAGTTCTCSSSFSTSQVSSGYACDTVCPGDPNGAAPCLNLSTLLTPSFRVLRRDEPRGGVQRRRRRVHPAEPDCDADAHCDAAANGLAEPDQPWNGPTVRPGQLSTSLKF
jgi:hypothetical protein